MGTKRPKNARHPHSFLGAFLSVAIAAEQSAPFGTKNRFLNAWDSPSSYSSGDSQSHCVRATTREFGWRVPVFDVLMSNKVLCD